MATETTSKPAATADGLPEPRSKQKDSTIVHLAVNRKASDTPSEPLMDVLSKPWSDQDNSALVHLPVNIMTILFPLLPLPSQVCLALTCRSLYSLLGHVCKDKRLEWPRLLASRSWKAFPFDSVLPRNQLLLQLQDNGALVCSACLKVHPRGRFCMLSKWKAVEKRTCRPQTPIADLCPCLAITVKDGERLAAWIATGECSPFFSATIRKLVKAHVVHGTRVLYHSCSMVHIREALVNLAMSMTLDSEGKLIVSTKYNIHWTTPQNIPHVKTVENDEFSTGEPVYLCPHDSLLGYICSPREWISNGCACYTRRHVLGYTNDCLNIVVQVVRNLGGMDSATGFWTFAHKTGRAHHLHHFRRWYEFHGEVEPTWKQNELVDAQSVLGVGLLEGPRVRNMVDVGDVMAVRGECMHK